MMPDLFMVFDVESIGLHGEGFAVGFVVVGMDGKVYDAGRYVCPQETARGVTDADTDPARKWLAANIPPMEATVTNPAVLRDVFWAEWLPWKSLGAALVADCGWPVEARFLAACVDQRPELRGWDGPYPLHELATFRLAAGFDPLATVERLPNELPAHDPLADARQSARLLLEALKELHRCREWGRLHP